ncbi:GAF domain-containing protein [Limnoglobus roseus]|uniref:GAF domain-containing protein n=1 Tax=Limnoglobus roseus TaxID=2598579 RepID=UPI0011EAB765|nr:GAF domain-containing protein [Limnoglobus roseus]
MTDPSGLDPLTGLQSVNAELQAARRAALNLMEDAVLARDNLRASEERQAFLLKLSDTLRPLADADAIPATAGRLVGEHLGLNRVTYFEVAGAEYVVTHEWPGDPPTVVGRHPLSTLGAKALADLRDGRTVVSTDVRADTDLPPALKVAYTTAEVLSYVSVPLVKGGVLVGGLGVTANHPQGWAADEVSLLEEVAERTWEAVNRAKAEAALRASEAWLAGQKEAFQAAVNGAPLAESLGVLARTAAEQAGDGTRCAFYLVDPARNALYPVVGMSELYAEAAKAFQIGRDALACGRAVATGRPVVIPDVTTAPAWGAWQSLAERHGIRGVWSFPVESATGRVVGTFALYFRSPRAASPRDLESAAGLARAAAIIISRGREADDRARAEAAVRDSEERFRLLVEHIPDHALFAKTPDGRVTSWNAGGERLFGYTTAEITGRSVAVLLTPEDRAAGRLERELAAAAANGRADEDGWMVRKDGRRFWSSGVCTAVRDADGRVAGFVKVVRDLTDRKRMEDELRAARDQLERRVAERTAELAAAVDALEAEIDRRRELALRLSAAQEEERKRVSRDLHDTVGQTHAGLSMALKAVAAAVPPGGVPAERLAYARKLADDMGRELHAAAVRLRPTALDDLGLEAALRDLTAAWSRREGVPADLYANLGGTRPAPEVETAVYRVVQEALTNVARHAGATAVSVMVTRADGTIQATVEDNGTGFDPAAAGTRLGLMGMRERLGLLRGELQIESEPGRGTTVIARLPEPTDG